MSTDASGSNRVNNIKSHGTLETTNGNQSVLLTAEDLKYLAAECDKLEDTVEGLSQTDSANIRYVYHHHTGSPTTGGGCYGNGKHVHVGDVKHKGGCYTDGYHKHIRETARDMGCYKCECTKEGNTCVKHKHTLNCGNKPINRWSETCNNLPLNSFELVCGWKEGEIVRAEITFSPSQQ